MTRARNGAATVAPARAPHWHVIPDDDDRGPSKTFPACADGDELLARLPGGEVVTVTVDRRRGLAFRREDGEAVEPDAIATPVREPSRSGRSLTESERGTESIKLRLRAGYKSRLQRLAEEDGYSVAEWVESWVEMAESEIAEFRRRPPKKRAG